MPLPLTATSLQIRCRALQNLHLPNPWSDLHGGFGLMLKAHWPVAFEELMGGREREAAVRPYLLCPDITPGSGDNADAAGPLAAKASPPSVLAGECFTLTLTLFGACARLWSGACDALARLGVNGVTAQRQHFRLEQIDARRSLLTNGPKQAIWAHGEWLTDHPPSLSLDLPASEAATPAPGGPCLLQLRYLSPLQIKLGDTLAQEPPALADLVRRGLARLSMLASHAGRVVPLSREERHLLVGHLQGAHLVQNDSARQRFDRFSHRQHQRIPVPGILGEQLWHLDAPAASALRPLAPLFELIHLGSKTSMGFGSVSLQFASPHAETGQR